MKNFFALLLIPFSFTVLAQTHFDDPIEYNDFVMNEQNKIGEKIISFMDEVANGTYESAKGKNGELLEQIKSSVKSVNNLNPFDGNTRLKEATLSLFRFYQLVCQTEYVKMIDIFFADDFSTEDEAEITSMIDDITAREAVYDEEFAAAQEEFAREHDFILEENDLQQKFDSEGP